MVEACKCTFILQFFFFSFPHTSIIMYLLKHLPSEGTDPGRVLTLVGVTASKWMTTQCVYSTPLPWLDWTVHSFPGSEPLNLHHCNGPAFMQFRRPFKRARWYSEVCVYVSVCACAYVYVCTLLMAIAYAWDPFWVEGWIYSDIKAIFAFFLCV